MGDKPRRHGGRKTLAQKIRERDELLKHAHSKIDGYTIQQLRHFLAARGPRRKHEVTNDPETQNALSIAQISSEASPEQVESDNRGAGTGVVEPILPEEKEDVGDEAVIEQPFRDTTMAYAFKNFKKQNKEQNKNEL